jgi:hypothetical protein
VNVLKLARVMQAHHVKGAYHRNIGMGMDLKK